VANSWVPPGWARGDTIVVPTYEPRIVVQRLGITPFNVKPGALLKIEFDDVAAYNAWLRWWFADDVPINPFA